MPFTTLISTEELMANLNDPSWVIIDCRFALTDLAQGRREYEQGHIPGAVYAHLDHDLSGPIIPGQTGRHPLPEVETFAQTLGNWGIDNDSQIVAYDANGGAFAARLWWMARWLGHTAVAVLNGGWPRWQAEGHPTASGTETNLSRTFTPNPRPELIFTAEDVQKTHTDAAYRLLDARSADRYRGENETLDPVGGHIPGAYSLPFGGNLAADGTFLPDDALKARLAAEIGQTPPEQVVMYCGSGVTAAHNALAMFHSGLGEARLYPGSWSEWLTDPTRPVETGSKG